MGFKHQLVVNEDGRRSLTVYISGEKPLIVAGTDPNYDEIQKLATSGNAEKDAAKLRSLASPAAGITDRFKALSDRVAVRGGKLYFDGDELHNALAEHIIRCLGDGEDIAKPFVNFVEKINMNPSQNSRESLYNWLENRFTITDDGNIIMYKGAQSDGNGGHQSVYTGTAIVDGKEVEGHIPYEVGSTITMPRSQVMDDPNSACNVGLHVATHDFAKNFGGLRGVCFKVEVDPRDVVSVPSHDRQKVRVCRMKVVELAPTPVVKPIERKPKVEPAKKIQTKGDSVKSTTRDALRKIAAKLGIEGRGSMSKAQLERAVASAQVSGLTRDDLRREAARLNIDGRGRMNKAQLERAVLKARGA